MANETFEHVVKQLKQNKAENSSGLEAVGKSVAALNDRMNKFFDGLAQQRLDDLEDRREKRKESNKVAAAAGGTTSKDTKGIGFLPLLFSKTGLAGSLLAIGGALSGLRGWELSALKAIKNIKLGVGENLTNSFRSLRTAILGGLGLDATLKKFNSPGSGLATPITTQIIDKFKGIKTNILKVFGLGADGKPIVVRGADGLFKTPVISKVTGFIGKLLMPIKLIGDGIETFFKTSGKGLLTFLKFLGIGSGAAALAGGLGSVGRMIGVVAKRILWPVGIIFSLKAGIDAYTDKEGSTFEKIVAGVTGFISDFLGAPLNLLKSLFTGALKKLGIGYDTETGKPTNFATKFLEEFDFVKAIKAIPNAIIAIIDGIVEFIKDPVGIGKQVLKGVVNGLKDFFLGAVKFIISKFPLMSAVAPDFLKTAGQKRLSDLQEQKRLLTGELEGRTDSRLQPESTGRMVNIRRAIKNRKEIERIEEMIRTGNFDAMKLATFGDLNPGINSATEARARLAELENKQSALRLSIQSSAVREQKIITMTDQLSRTERDIAELAVALKNNPGFMVDNKDLSSTTNNSYTNSQAMIAADNLGFNTQNFEFRPVR